jgi:hypothetical protein
MMFVSGIFIRFAKNKNDEIFKEEWIVTFSGKMCSSCFLYTPDAYLNVC